MGSRGLLAQDLRAEATSVSSLGFNIPTMKEKERCYFGFFIWGSSKKVGGHGMNLESLEFFF